MYQPGEVFLVPFPFSSMQTSKQRPVLALTPPDTFADMVCLAITSSPLHHAAFPLDNECFLEGILPKPSWVRLDKVYTLNAGLFVGRFGSLHAEVFERVKRHFCEHFGCHLLNR